MQKKASLLYIQSLFDIDAIFDHLNFLKPFCKVACRLVLFKVSKLRTTPHALISVKSFLKNLFLSTTIVLMFLTIWLCTFLLPLVCSPTMPFSIAKSGV